MVYSVYWFVTTYRDKKNLDPRIAFALGLAALAGAVSLGAYKWIQGRRGSQKHLATKQSSALDPQHEEALSKRLAQLRTALAVPKSKLDQFLTVFIDEMKEGLLENGSSSLKMIPTFVSKLPVAYSHLHAFTIVNLL